MKQLYCIAFSLCFCYLTGCKPAPEPPRRAFYHWKTRLALSAEERAYIDRLGVSALYVKFFDVDWSDNSAGPVPLAEVVIDTQRLGGLHIVPCVFITNRTMTQLSAEAVPELAARMLKKTDELALQYPGLRIEEIQMDCDWTASTRERYFALLKHLRASLAARGILLSATVRLHQYRWPEQTGVPPADRGMLMCYNVGELESWEEENSILRASEAGKYFSGAGKYPLTLDGALPVFGWGVLFRNDRMIRLLHGLSPQDLADTLRFRPLEPHRFEVIKSTYLDGHYLYEGDRLRIETPAAADLEESARMMRTALRRSKEAYTVALYHLDTTAIKGFSREAVESLYR
jgi:hypothetical protein